MNQTIRPEQIHYLSNRLGECIPEKTGRKYIDWWVSIDGEECSYLVEITTPTGYRIGALFLDEFAHTDSPDHEDKKWAEENNVGGSKKVLERLRIAATKLKEKGFIAAAFEKTGPFERHELVGFVPYPQRKPDKNDWLGVIGEPL
jgi:hypothetical protein